MYAEAMPRGRIDPAIDLRRLTQFLAVAEHRGFSRAAEALHLSQQALSSAVGQLERELGVQLVDRSTRRIALTPAGTTLRDDALPLLAAVRTLVQRVRDTAATAPEAFVVAHTPAITGDEVFELLNPVRRSHPELSITVHQMFPDELAAAILDGSAHLGLRRGVATPKSLAAAVIDYHHLRIAMRAGHRLAHRKTLAIKELASERIVVWAPPGHSFYTDFLFSTCRRAGFEPSHVVNRVQGTPPITAVIDTDDVAFVTAPPGPAAHGNVMVIGLSDPPLVPVQALWLRHTTSAAREALLNRT